MDLASALAFTIAVMVAFSAGYALCSVLTGRVLGGIGEQPWCEVCGVHGRLTPALPALVPMGSRWRCAEHARLRHADPSDYRTCCRCNVHAPARDFAAICEVCAADDGCGCDD